jgi:mRNA interferase RelE/StbE
MLKLEITNHTFNFIKQLPPKQFKQIHLAIYDLMKKPESHDSKKLKGFSDLLRKDIGEYRIIYRFDSENLYIELIGKRNDDEVYKQMKRLLS